MSEYMDKLLASAESENSVFKIIQRMKNNGGAKMKNIGEPRDLTKAGSFENMTNEFSSVNSVLDKVDAIDKRKNDAMNNMPDFSIYNALEKAAQESAATNAIKTETDGAFASLLSSIDTQLMNLHNDITKRKFPLANSSDSTQALRGAVEYNTAVAIMQNLKTTYPTNEVKEYSLQKRVDLASALIDLGLKKKQEGFDENNERADFQAVVTAVNNAIGVLPLQREKFNLERARFVVEMHRGTAMGVDNIGAIALAFQAQQLDSSLGAALKELTIPGTEAARYFELLGQRVKADFTV